MSIGVSVGNFSGWTTLKKAGSKVTLPRLKVLEVLEKTAEPPHHMSAEDVYKQLIISDDTVGLATVYRVLTQFEAAGIVNRHHFDDGHSVYELADEFITIAWWTWIMVRLLSL